jgi:hypothetical protein
MSAADLAGVIRRRFPQAGADLEPDLAACEEAAWGDIVNPRQALKLIQTLDMHYQKLKQAARPGSPATQNEVTNYNQLDREGDHAQ